MADNWVRRDRVLCCRHQTTFSLPSLLETGGGSRMMEVREGFERRLAASATSVLDYNTCFPVQPQVRAHDPMFPCVSMLSIASFRFWVLLYSHPGSPPGPRYMENDFAF